MSTEIQNYPAPKVDCTMFDIKPKIIRDEKRWEIITHNEKEKAIKINSDVTKVRISRHTYCDYTPDVQGAGGKTEYVK